MAVVGTYLDVLVETLTEPAARAAYLRDPAGWLRDAGVGYLCGEDVIAGAPVICGWRPDLDPAFAVLEAADPQPAPGETELDAAVRVLGLVLAEVPLELEDEAGGAGRTDGEDEEDRAPAVGDREEADVAFFG
jgi:hypothetical protein